MKSAKYFSLIAITLISLFICSCSGIMGYGVLLWSVPEHGLSDGEVVPVYIRSNIGGVYVIGLPGTKEKIEVPLWQVTEPVSKRKAEKKAERYADYQHIYARVVFDGLPMRNEAVNTSKQVYRLRNNEIIKVLYKGTGVSPMSGNSALEGEWLRVLASDGTMGWCFSYNLRLFDENEQDATIEHAVVERDDALENILAAFWYPESYHTMVRRKMVDIARMKPYPAFDTGAASGTVRFEYDDVSVSYPYNGVTKVSDNVYKFNDTPLNMTVRKSNYIVVQYTDEKGMPASYNLVTLEKTSEELIAEEKERRRELLESLYEFGPNFKSSSYGTFVIKEDGGFEWKGYKQLVPNVIPKNSGFTGTVSFDYFINSSLSVNYDGVLILTFDKTGKRIPFFYKLEDGGMRIEDATHAHIKDNIVNDRGSGGVVVYFAASGGNASSSDDDSEDADNADDSNMKESF